MCSFRICGFIITDLAFLSDSVVDCFFVTCANVNWTSDFIRFGYRLQRKITFQLASKRLMMNCVNCNTSIVEETQHYLLSDLGPELVSAAERLIHREINANDHMCEECFNLLMREPLIDPPAPASHLNFCVWCERSLIPSRRPHSLPVGPERSEVSRSIAPREVHMDSRVCYRCWMRAHRLVQRHLIVDQDRNQAADEIVVDVDQHLNENDPEPGHHLTVLPHFRCTGNSSSRCFVHGCTNNERLRVPIYLKKLLLKSYKFYVTPEARVCREHITIYNWDFLNEHSYINQFTSEELEKMFELLSEEDDIFLDFEKINHLEDYVCRFWTGVAKTNFLAILDEVPEFRQRCKSHKTALGLYLIKLRTGEPDLRLSLIFKMSETNVRRLLNIARKYLSREFVPRHLGVGHISRQGLIERNLHIPEGLYGNNRNSAIIICDGTYVYCQKSSNYYFQKKSYSLHKYRNLVKPFMIVNTDGYIVDIFGPYAATDSDADIMKDLFENPASELRQYFRENDIFILDRGFRDAIPLLQSLNYKVYKPESLREGEFQLSTIRANKSRCVTLCRWVVEVVNGRFKRDFKLFRNNFSNRAATHLMQDFRIAGAIINAFHMVLSDRPDSTQILLRALERLNVPNLLGTYVIENNINRRRAMFVSINANIPALGIFPEMTSSDLILFALGIYQIKQARSYYGEHIRENGTFDVEVSNTVEPIQIPGIESHETVLIRGRIKSRHQSQKTYYCYILLDLEFDNWQQRITQYYCNCIVGQRTVGCCAHLMTLVWYLGWARYQNNITAPATFLDGILVRDDVENE